MSRRGSHCNQKLAKLVAFLQKFPQGSCNYTKKVSGILKVMSRCCQMVEVRKNIIPNANLTPVHAVRTQWKRRRQSGRWRLRRTGASASGAGEGAGSSAPPAPRPSTDDAVAFPTQLYSKRSRCANETVHLRTQSEHSHAFHFSLYTLLLVFHCYPYFRVDEIP